MLINGTARIILYPIELRY